MVDVPREDALGGGDPNLGGGGDVGARGQTDEEEDVGLVDADAT